MRPAGRKFPLQNDHLPGMPFPAVGTCGQSMDNSLGQPRAYRQGCALRRGHNQQPGPCAQRARELSVWGRPS